MTSFEQEYNKSCCGHIRLSLLNHQQQHHHLKNHSTPPPLGYTFYNDHSVKSPSNIRGSPEGNYPLFTSYDKENYLPPAFVIEQQQQQEKLLNKKTPLAGFEHCHPNNHPHHHRHPEQKLHQHRNNSSSETHSFIRNSVYFSCSRSFVRFSINQSINRKIVIIISIFFVPLLTEKIYPVCLFVIFYTFRQFCMPSRRLRRNLRHP